MKVDLILLTSLSAATATNGQKTIYIFKRGSGYHKWFHQVKSPETQEGK